MTLDVAKRICRTLGFTLVKRDGEFIVKPSGATIDDARTYFTDDLDDAVGTARAMVNVDVVAELTAQRTALHAELSAALTSGANVDPQWFADRADEMGYLNRRLIALGAIPVIA